MSKSCWQKSQKITKRGFIIWKPWMIPRHFTDVRLDISVWTEHPTTLLWSAAGVKSLETSWGSWRASRPPWLCQGCSSWCPSAKRSRHPSEAPRRRTGNAADPLSCNVLCEPPSSGEGDRSRRVGRWKRHRERWEAGCLRLDWKGMRGLGNRGGGSVCRGASGRSKQREHRCQNTFLWDHKTQSSEEMSKKCSDVTKVKTLWKQSQQT